MSPFYVKPKPGDLEFSDDDEYHFAMRQARNWSLRGALFVIAGAVLLATSHSWLQVAASIAMIVSGSFILAVMAAQAVLGHRYRKRSSGAIRPPEQPSQSTSHLAPSILLVVVLLVVLVAGIVTKGSTVHWILWVAGLVLASTLAVIGLIQRRHPST